MAEISPLEKEGREKKELISNLYETGELPNLQLLSEKTEKQLDPEVKETRENLETYIYDQMPYLDRNILTRLNSKQLMNLFLYYFNNKPSYDHFLKIIETVGSKDLRIYLDKKNKELKGELNKENLPELHSAYLIYLYNKLPIGLKQREGKNGKIEKIKIEKKDEVINVEDLTYEAASKIGQKLEGKLDQQVMTAIDFLENLFIRREKEMGYPLIAFHTSDIKNIKGKINVPYGKPQEYWSPSGSGIISAGSKFFSFKLKQLFPAEYLYLVYSNTSDLEKIYDPSTTAATSSAPLDTVPTDELLPIHLTHKVTEDLGASFGQF